MGGCTIVSCNGMCITDYEIHYGEDGLYKHAPPHYHILSLYRTFNFCPYCGKPIELPWWMTDDKEWEPRVNSMRETYEKFKIRKTAKSGT